MQKVSELNFYFYWKKSLVIHFVVIAIVILGSKFNLWDYFQVNPETIMPSVRVDIVALPKYTLEELKKMEIAPAPANPEELKENKNETVKTNQLEEKVENDDSKIEEIFKKIEKSAVKKRKENIKKEKELKSIEDRRNQMREMILAGNQIKTGALSQGDEQNSKNTAFDQYLLEVTEKVRLNWKLPSYLQRSSYKCRIQLFINSQGKLELIKIIESSGNAEFDSWAMKAIEETVPLKVPELKIVPELLRGKFILGFPL